MKKKSLLLPVILLLFACAAVYLLYRVRSNLEVLTERSLPALRTLGDLRDTISRLQIAILEGELQGAELVPQVLNERRLRLKGAAGLIDDYRSTMANPRDHELIDRVSVAFEVYRVKVENLLSSGSVIDERRFLLSDCISVHHSLQHKLAELRNYRMGRVEDRISSVDRVADGMWKTNFVALCVLVVAILLIGLLAWLGRYSDPDPQNF